MTDTPLTQPYIPNTDIDREEMLRAAGVSVVDDLFQDIPVKHRNPVLDIPEPLSEIEVVAKIAGLAARNFDTASHPSFVGAGVYRHFIPAVVPALVSRGEFLTSYTPYQPEVSQGTLQGTYEFQTMTAQLLGMEVANAGMYDGATSLAEAALMACRITRRYRVAVVDTVNPSYLEVVRTYTAPQGIEVYKVPAGNIELAPGTACLLVQYPNYYGSIEPVADQAKLAHEAGALLCTSSDPVAMAMFNSPGLLGADIATSEGQALGVPASFGGPYVGLFACKQEHLRQMPGRIVGKTVDTQGRTGYVLTLQPREQHIRRERATSNICTSTALIGLWATAWTATMGRRGLRHLAELAYQKAHYAAARIAEIPGYSLPTSDTFFQEFVVSCPQPAEVVNNHLQNHGIVGGVDVGGRYRNGVLFCVTEVNTREQIDKLVGALREVL